ncbi:aminoglycoside phosphotransferase family protein [Streptomyces caatingaensis]|uniref:Kinase n=1 Tax=Streptomyces caatingaensis TaxID=1678637 RepID=A0A0K9XDT6_9ACTN|nr:aminoglycoside phosphotransferase family protein [Streptomyces caatingaensis]KNB51589.1 kinase [Streptomyces caatingaensis]
MPPVPAEFARLTAAREGEAGRRWLRGLPGLLSRLLGRWGLVPDGAVTHGQVGIVVPVGPGGGAVLKVSFPHPGNVHEPDAFAAWGGRGAVRLLERDDAAFAMLLERAGPGSLVDLPGTDEAMAAAGALARRLAVPAPPRLPRLDARAGEWERLLRRGDLPPRVRDAALAAVRDLGAAQPDLLVHGDLHARNVLRGGREEWLAIDPKGVVGDPAYDAFTMVRSRHEELLAAPDPVAELRRRLAVFAEAAGLDRRRAVGWAQLRCAMAAVSGRERGEQRWLTEAYAYLAGALV